ncbi:MAG: methyltransferase domain-containing protein [Gillisia sp.]
MKRIKEILKISPYNLYENIYSRYIKKVKLNKQKREIQKYLENEEIKKLQLGSGVNILPGWLNTDLKSKTDITFFDAGEPFPIPTESFHFIFNEHLFEHLKIEQQLSLLKESHRILKKGGVLRIAMPNLDFLISLYSEPNLKFNREYIEWAMNHSPLLRRTNNLLNCDHQKKIYVINNFFKAWGHQLIHNYESIREMASQCGFKNIYQVEIGKSAFMELNNIEKHGAVIPPKMNEIETMVIEMVK